MSPDSSMNVAVPLVPLSVSRLERALIDRRCCKYDEFVQLHEPLTQWARGPALSHADTVIHVFAPDLAQVMRISYEVLKFLLGS